MVNISNLIWSKIHVWCFWTVIFHCILTDKNLKKYVINEMVCLFSNINAFEQYFACSLNISYIYQYILIICPSSSSQVPNLYPTTFLTSCLPFGLLLLLANPWVQLVLPLYAWVWGHSLEHELPILGHCLQRKETPSSQQSSASNSSSDRGVARSPSPLTLEF